MALSAKLHEASRVQLIHGAPSVDGLNDCVKSYEVGVRGVSAIHVRDNDVLVIGRVTPFRAEKQTYDSGEPISIVIPLANVSSWSPKARTREALREFKRGA